MGKRSLKASQTGITRAKQAFQRKGWTQEYLAAEVGLETRQSVWKFFAGRPIERHLFIDICFRLDLDWEDIVELPEVEPLPTSVGEASIEQWLEQARSRLCSAIRQQCGVLQTALDMPYPLAVEQVYTQICVLPQPSHQRWLEILDFENFNQFDRLQPRLSDQSMTGLEAVAAHSKLMILGKPGSGKTTFLQFLALQYTQAQTQQIPVYISLRQFAADARKQGDFRLESYIVQQWSAHGLTQDQIETLLQQGKALVLLDGLDTVALTDSGEVYAQIQSFAETYAANSIVLTSRIGAQEYCFRGFTTVEIADFDDDQITTAVHNWFAAANSRSADSPDSARLGLAVNGLAANGLVANLVTNSKAEQFLAQLQYPQNQPIRELVTTPIFLHLACLVFQTRSTFPIRPARLYEAGLEILLVRWDSARGICRDSGCCDPAGNLGIRSTAARDLTLSDKISLLGRIAAVMFEQGKQFFEKREVLQVIADYFDPLPIANGNVEDLWLKSEAILKAIVLQHGLLVERARDIYSFSHLIFQEYLTAKHIVGSLATGNHSTLLQAGSQHFADPVWRNVLLLAASLLDIKGLLSTLKQQIDCALKERLQPNLNWAAPESAALQQSPYPSNPLLYHPTAVRAFYFSLIQDQDVSLAERLDHRLLVELEPNLLLDLELTRILAVGRSLTTTATAPQILKLHQSLEMDQHFQVSPTLAHSIRALQAQFPIEQADTLMNWWQVQGQNWLRDLGKTLLEEWQEQGQHWQMQLRHCLKQYRNLAEDWQFSQQHRSRLQQYYRVHTFLLDCLQGDRQVTDTYRQQLEATLLLAGTKAPVSDIQAINKPIYKAIKRTVKDCPLTASLPMLN